MRQAAALADRFGIPRVCRASCNRPRAESMPARLPIWRPNRPDDEPLNPTASDLYALGVTPTKCSRLAAVTAADPHGVSLPYRQDKPCRK